MAKAPERTQRRHVREKATIDHLVQDVYKPEPADEKHPGHSPTTSSGVPVEDRAHPVENLLDDHSGPGSTRWLSARPDTIEHIVVEFDKPQTISPLVYEVEEAMRERTQEVRVEFSADGARTYRQILVPEYTFSPRGATYQREEQRFDLYRVTHLRLTIVPNKNGSGATTLTALRLFA